MESSRDAAASRTIEFAVRGPIAHADLPGLCARVCAQLTGVAGGEVGCDVTGVPADAGTVEVLARLQLGAHRNGCKIRLRNASPELLELLELMGLTEVLPG